MMGFHKEYKERGRNTRRRAALYLVLLCIVIMGTGSLLAACAYYGRLRVQSPRASEATTKDLLTHWDEYHIRYWHPRWPRIVVFDPKGDDKRVQTPGWAPVSNQEGLSWVLRGVRKSPRAELFQILGPEGQFYGYLLSGPEHLAVRAVGEKKLQVYLVRFPNPAGV